MILAMLAGFGVAIILVIVIALTNPFPSPKKIPSVNSVGLSKISVNQSQAETAARDDLDIRAQGNGQQAGFYRGGMLGSADLIYVDSDGTNYIVDKEDGKLVENLPFPIDSSKPHEYIWRIALNYGNTTKNEYIYAVDGNNGTAWMIGVID